MSALLVLPSVDILLCFHEKQEARCDLASLHKEITSDWIISKLINLISSDWILSIQNIFILFSSIHFIIVFVLSH